MDKQHEPANVGQRAKLADLEDFTKLGGYKKGSTKRCADKDSDKESRDTKHDDFSEFSHKDDDERHRQPIFKGDGYDGSITSDDWLNKDYIKSKLKVESFDIDMSAMKSLLETTIEDQQFVAEALDVFKATMETKLDELYESVLDRAVDTITENTLEIQEALEEQYDAAVESMNESIEEYLDAAVLEWASENRLAIQESTEAALAQSFMSDLASLLEAYSVKVPEDKTDLYESALEAGEKLYSEFEQLAEEYDNLATEFNETKKILATESFIDEAGLSLMEAEQIRKLANNLEFTDADSFLVKLDMIGESYINLQESKQQSQQQYNPYVDTSLLEDFYDEETYLEEDYSDEHPDVAGILESLQVFKK